MTPMQQNSECPEQISYLTGSKVLLERVGSVPVRQCCDSLVLAFLESLSAELFSDEKNRAFSDITAYAFWIRKGSLARVQEKFSSQCKLGRGVALHIAPSNVPINFAVSMTSSLLAGNPTVVRVSAKEFEQVDIIVAAVNRILAKEEFAALRPYLLIIRYDRNKTVNDFLSSLCDVRVVWGGNQTVAELRGSPLPPRAMEMTFPDRHSIALINADEYLCEDAIKVAEKFYTDTYFSDQNACSSPRLIVWFGNKVEEAKERFWSALKETLRKKDYQMPDILAVDNLNAFCLLAAEQKDVFLKVIKTDNILVRAELSRVFDRLMDYKMGGGYFFEYTAGALDDLIPVLGKSCQTVSYLGIEPENIRDFIFKSGVRGVDRIVPIGKTMELAFRWDGFDMIGAMSRYIDVM